MITIDMSEIVTAITESGDVNSEILNTIAAQLAMQNMLLGIVTALLFVTIFAVVWGRH